MQEPEKQENLVKQYITPFGINFLSGPILISGVVIILLGILTGFILSSKNSIGGNMSKKQTTSTGGVAAGTIFGSDDMKTFKDTTEGTLKKGGIEGEGSHHLERPGGVSQNVYLTSSIVDLEQFIDRKIKVWGETNKAKKAGWLMDVGKVEVLE